MLGFFALTQPVGFRQWAQDAGTMLDAVNEAVGAGAGWDGVWRGKGRPEVCVVRHDELFCCGTCDVVACACELDCVWLWDGDGEQPTPN